jgi:NAD(P)H-dependent flavin oxidoreductase YrpB (nitropropane dioxygenase family)
MSVRGLLGSLGVQIPVLAAPMAGGPTTPAMVLAAHAAGSLGFLAGGYKTPESIAAQIAEVRAAAPACGVNLFAPNPLPVEAAAFASYAAALQAEAGAYGVELTGGEPVEDDDGWQDKIDLLLADPVPLVGFTFGVPDAAVVASLRRAGSLTVQTVTSADEAVLAAERGVDLLAVQGSGAGGHFGTLTPLDPPASPPLAELVREVCDRVDLPVVAAGGLATPQAVAGVLAAGAVAAMVGTVLLRTHESGASIPHKAALAATPARETVVTRAFTGRPARGLRNLFVDRFDAIAPYGYPAIHHLTSPLRRAAAAAGDPEWVNLWAGTGYREGREESTADALTRLAANA